MWAEGQLSGLGRERPRSGVPAGEEAVLLRARQAGATGGVAGQRLARMEDVDVAALDGRLGLELA
jgi:hypothetical protein